MKIEINKKEYNVKPITELTISEYVSYMKSIEKSSGNYEQLINYLSVVLGLEVGTLENINISDKSINRLLAYIGTVQPIDIMPPTDKFYYKRKGRTIYRNSTEWRTLGARKMLEERNLKTIFEQSVYLLACYISRDYDYDNIENIYNDLQDYNAIEVYSFIVFFLKRL